MYTCVRKLAQGSGRDQNALHCLRGDFWQAFKMIRALALPAVPNAAAFSQLLIAVSANRQTVESLQPICLQSGQKIFERMRLYTSRSAWLPRERILRIGG